MKKVILILACAVIAGCGYPTAEDGTTLDEVGFVSIHVRKVRGHDYIVAAYGGRGVSVVHAASCPCMAPKMYSIEEFATTNRIPNIGDYLMEGK
ncbi:MAG: hypothetical protein IJJ84_12785 [Kiritimatiellae bacterium]|nr:hypothetical protein [Kiritimatiellia bacterium]